MGSEMCIRDRAYVVFGSGDGSTPVRNLGTLDASEGFALEGIVAGDRAGRDVAGIGDVNGDGYDDIAIGADRADTPFRDSSSFSLRNADRAGLPERISIVRLI